MCHGLTRYTTCKFSPMVFLFQDWDINLSAIVMWLCGYTGQLLSFIFPIYSFLHECILVFSTRDVDPPYEPGVLYVLWNTTLKQFFTDQDTLFHCSESLYPRLFIFC